MGIDEKRQVKCPAQVWVRMLLFLPGATAGIANPPKSSFPMRLDCRGLQTANATDGRIEAGTGVESVCHV